MILKAVLVFIIACSLLSFHVNVDARSCSIDTDHRLVGVLLLQITRLAR